MAGCDAVEGYAGRSDRAISEADTLAAVAGRRMTDSSRRSLSQDGASEASTVLVPPVSVFGQGNESSAAPRTERQGWMRRRPGATFFEKLQVSY